MTTAIDTNVISSLLGGSSEERQRARTLFRVARQAGELVLSPVAYAELMALPGRSTTVLEAFLTNASIRIDWHLPEPIWRSAALAYRAYAERRRAQKGDPGPRRILADFLIGAHAQAVADTLLTFDPQLYRSAFPSLALQG